MLSKSIVDIEATSGSRVISGNAGGPQQREYGTTYSTGRLKKITYPGTGNYSQFVYDGVGNLVQISEYSSSTVLGTKNFVWSAGTRPAECRNASYAVVSQYFGLGQMDASAGRFYALNFLGSVTESTDNSGNVLGEQSFNPFGQPIRLQGSYSPDFAYAGYYFHSRSGLNVTQNRLYSSSFGRWLNRDPLNTSTATNLYEYAENDPILNSDPTGLCVQALYSQSKHKFFAIDSDTGTKVECDSIFSGNGPWANNPNFDWLGGRGPIPGGDYGIDPEVPLPGHPGKYEFPVTPANPGRRGDFFIHSGTESNGCITFRSTVKDKNDSNYPDNPCYNKLRCMLNSTKPCPDGSKGHLCVTP
jgi:RHS repeat-associated protein